MRDMADLFMGANADHDGSLTMDELIERLTYPRLNLHLYSHALDASDAMALFELWPQTEVVQLTSKRSCWGPPC